MAKQKVKQRQDITGSNCLKGVSGKMIVDEKGIKDTWNSPVKMGQRSEKISKKLKIGVWSPFSILDNISKIPMCPP